MVTPSGMNSFLVFKWTDTWNAAMQTSGNIQISSLIQYRYRFVKYFDDVSKLFWHGNIASPKQVNTQNVVVYPF